MRREKVLSRGWAHGIAFLYALIVLAAMVAAAGLPRF
jgi:hypothetical protein